MSAYATSSTGQLHRAPPTDLHRRQWRQCVVCAWNVHPRTHAVFDHRGVGGRVRDHALIGGHLPVHRERRGRHCCGSGGGLTARTGCRPLDRALCAVDGVCLDVTSSETVEADAVGLAADRDRWDGGGARGEGGLELRRDRRVVGHPAVLQQHRP